jgi:hypothetical protein
LFFTFSIFFIFTKKIAFPNEISKKITIFAAALRNRWREEVWPVNVAFGYYTLLKSYKSWI